MIEIKGRQRKSNINILANIKKRKIQLQTHKIKICNRIKPRYRDLNVNILKSYTQQIN